MSRTVWAFRPLPELQGRTGYVECEDDLAEQLLADESVQNLELGATAFKEIEAAPPAKPESIETKPAPEYDTKVMTPRRPK